MPKRIQRKRSRGWRMPENTIYVGRPTQFGNPFFVGRQGTPEECIWLYEHWITTQMPILLSEIKEKLRGKNLACWCKEGEPCHADVLLKIANAAQPSVAADGINAAPNSDEREKSES